MSFKLVVLLLFIAIAHVGAEVSEDEEPSADGPFMLRFNKEFIDETHWINQVFFREFIKSYGHRDLLKKSDRLQWLVKNPPYGKYKDLCVAYTMMRRDLFYLGSIVSDYMFIYFSTLGRTLQRASNEDGSPKPYLKYFDKVSLHLGCQGYEADELMLNLADYFDDAATDFGPLAKKYKVNAEMEAMQQRLKHINEQPDVVYNAKDCNDMKMEGYLLDKLKEIKEAYEKLADTANDDEVGDLFKMYRDISPVASTFFLCIGAKNKLAEEVDGQVIYQMRQVMATMMTKEQEKEKILLSTIKNASFHMDLRHNRRYTIIDVPKNSTVSCYGNTTTLEEDSKLVVKHCFTICQQLIEEEQRVLKEGGCKDEDGSPTECQFCEVTVAKEDLNKFWASDYTNFMEDKGEYVIFHFPTPNYTHMIPELLSPDHIQRLLDMEIDYERDPPADFTPPVEEMGKYRFEYEQEEDLDIMPYVWLSVKTAIVTTLVIWSIYIYNVFRFRLWRWFSRKREQMYRWVLGM